MGRLQAEARRVSCNMPIGDIVPTPGPSASNIFMAELPCIRDTLAFCVSMPGDSDIGSPQRGLAL